MSAPNATQQPSIGLKRSGSINNLLRSKAGSLRRKDGHKRENHDQGNMLLQNVSLGGATDGAWQSTRTSLDKRPVVAYAVTISAGNPHDSKKPREKRRMLERILHKRTPSKGLMTIHEGDGSKTPKRSITPAILREAAFASKRSSRGHSRSASALSFFQPETTRTVPVENGDLTPVPRGIFASQQRPSSSGESTPKGRSPLVTKYSPVKPVQRKPVFIRTSSQGSTTSEATSEDGKPERPKLKVITGPDAGTSHSVPNLLNAAHPPRKSSLPGSEAILPRTDSDSERAISSKDALAASFESASKHRRKRSQEMAETSAPVVRLLDPIGPTPPPKDNDKGYHNHQMEKQLQKSLNVDIPDISPLRVSAIIGEAGTRRNAFNPSDKLATNYSTLPSPQLTAPRQSTLSSRRKAVPGSLAVPPKSRKANTRGVLGGILSPAHGSNNRVTKSRGSSRGSSRLTSPALGKTMSSRKDVKRGATAPPVPARRAPRPPLVIKTQQPLSEPRMDKQTDVLLDVPQKDQLGPLSDPTTIPTTITRAPSIAEADHAPTPPAKSPKRIGSMKRRSVSESSILGADGVHHRARSHRRKSVHRRKPTGFRLTKEKEAILRGRAVDRPGQGTLPSSLEQTAISMVTGRRQRSQSPHSKSNGLTPPQGQGEWMTEARGKEKGRRQPSPLRSSENIDSTGCDQDRRPDVGARSSTNNSSESDASRGRTKATTTTTMTTSIQASTSTSTSTALRPAALTLEQHAAQFESIRRNGTLKGNQNRPRAASRSAAMQPGQATMVLENIGTGTSLNPLAAHPTVANSAEVKAMGRAKLVDAGHKVTPEESIKRMMEKQERQAVAMRMKLLGLGPKREGEVR